MIICPIVSDRKISNVQVSLSNVEVVRRHVCYDDAGAGDIIVNREKFSESSFSDLKQSDSSVIDFIRSKSILYPRDFLVTTSEERDSNYYNVYKVSQPPRKVNDSLDRLYNKAILDLRKEIPMVKNRGRYISFDKLGISDSLTTEKIAKLKKIVQMERDKTKWPELFKQEGISDLKDTIDFINNFNFVVLSETTIPEESLQDSIKALSNINTRDFKNLNNYYKIAKTNRDAFATLSYISKLIYGRPLRLVQDKDVAQKQLIKKFDFASADEEYKNAA